jgi:hypothetical protein
MKTDECVLFSGAANGAESEFGAAAERRGIDEVNFTFEGHKDARSRGIRVLTHEELKHGDVSLSYVSNLMHRRYPDTRLFMKVLQSIWHQVNSGQDIYVIGKILDDGTVKGGTGWGGRVRKTLQQAALRLRSGPERLVSLDGRELGVGARTHHHPPALHGHRHPLHRGEWSRRDRGAVRSLFSVRRSQPATRPVGSDDKARLSKHPSFEKRAFRLHPATPPLPHRRGVHSVRA